MLFALPLPVQARQVVFLYAHSTYRHSQTILLSLRSVFFYLPYLSPCKHGRWYFATLIPPTGTRKQSCSRCARCFFICLTSTRASTTGGISLRSFHLQALASNLALAALDVFLFALPISVQAQKVRQIKKQSCGLYARLFSRWCRWSDSNRHG